MSALEPYGLDEAPNVTGMVIQVVASRFYATVKLLTDSRLALRNIRALVVSRSTHIEPEVAKRLLRYSTEADVDTDVLRSHSDHMDATSQARALIEATRALTETTQTLKETSEALDNEKARAAGLESELTVAKENANKDRYFGTGRITELERVCLERGEELAAERACVNRFEVAIPKLVEAVRHAIYEQEGYSQNQSALVRATRWRAALKDALPGIDIDAKPNKPATPNTPPKKKKHK